MFGDVDSGPAILPAHGHALEDAQGDKGDGGSAAHHLIVRQEADSEGGAAHEDDGHQERALAAERVADASEDQRANGTEDKADRKSTRLNSSHMSISYAVFCLK